MCWEIEWDEFLKLADSFMKFSEKAGDCWCFQGNGENLGGAYLVKKGKRRGVAKKKLSDRCDLEEANLGNCREDTVVHTVNDDVALEQFWEHHIVYSVSYRVPVVYFNAWWTSGELLTLEEIWNEIPDSFKPGDLKGLWSVVTQQEHPVLGKPFFQVHPCRTAKFLSSLKEVAGKNVFIPWLSSLGPLVNLDLGLLYALENTVNKDVN